jgi:hypothetical protein
VVVAAATFTLLLSGCAGIAEVGLHVDGPGVGFLDEGQGWVPVVALLGSIAVLVGFVARWSWSAVGMAFGGVGFVLFLVSGAPRTLLARSFRRKCDAGNAWACAAMIKRVAPGDPERLGFARRACPHGPVSACETLLREGTQADRAALCGDFLRRCDADSPPATRHACHVVRSGCAPPRPISDD